MVYMFVHVCVCVPVRDNGSVMQGLSSQDSMLVRKTYIYCYIGTYASRFHIGILQYHECHYKNATRVYSGIARSRVTSLLVVIERYQKGEQFCFVSTVYFYKILVPTARTQFHLKFLLRRHGPSSSFGKAQLTTGTFVKYSKCTNRFWMCPHVIFRCLLDA